MKGGKSDDKPLSEGHLKVLTGKFDIETIFVLNLNNQLLSSLGSVGTCVNLVFLDLTQNKIKDLQPLSKLSSLQVAKFGKNFISTFEPMQNSIKLVHIDLHGNSIKGAKSLAVCKGMRNLSSIYLQTMDGQFKNPVCDDLGYRDKVFDTIPQLKRLDGVSKGKKIDFDVNLAQSKSLNFQMDKSNVVWYTKDYPELKQSAKNSATLDDTEAKKSLSSCSDLMKDLEKQLAKLGAR